MTFEHIRKMLIAPELSDIRLCFTGILEHATGSLGCEQEGADAIANSRFLFTLPKSLLQWSVEKMCSFGFDHGLRRETHRKVRLR